MNTSTSQRPDILMTGAYPEWDLEPMARDYTLHKLWEASDKDLFLAANASRIRAIATRGDLGASAKLIAQLPKLEVIACYGVGTDAIDLAAANARGIRVTNTPDVLSGDVADLAVGMTLAMLREIPQADAYVRSGAWTNASMGLTRRLYGKKIGIAGYGRIGATVARRLSGFDVEVGYFSTRKREESPHVYFAELSELATWCDVLIVTVAGGPGTMGLVSKPVLACLGKTGYLVNVSRGSTVDEQALLEALEQQTIAGAALDVFCNEPKIDPRFLKLRNVLLQPHHASGTIETRKAMGALVRDNLAAHFQGNPLPTPVI